MSEYLFRRTHWLGGEGLVSSSALMTTTHLLQQVRFRADMQRHEDLDWLLRASQRPGVQLLFADTTDPLAIWHNDAQRETLSTRKDWRYSLAWIQGNRHLVTRRAYASFVLTWISANAVQQGERSGFLTLLTDACRHGAPSARDLCVFVGILLMPRSARQRLSDLVIGAPGHR